MEASTQYKSEETMENRETNQNTLKKTMEEVENKKNEIVSSS